MIDALRRFYRHEDKNLKDNRWIFTSMLVGALLGLVAAFVLSIEALQLAKDPSAALSCSVNVIVNCATVAKDPSATMFGFPNSFLGLISEPIVITVAIAGLAGVKFPRLFMFGAQIGYTLGLIFALYLFAVSFFVIGALCPWCILVTLTTTFVWFAITRFNIREGNLYLSKQVSEKAKVWIRKDFDKLALGIIVVVLFASVLLKYGNGIFGY